MKFMKWRFLAITCVVCLLPILLGVALWNSLPDTMAIHFDMYNNPDNFAPKGFVVFGLPCLMVLLQVICCVINDINASKHGDRQKFERVTKWIIPVMTMILQVVTLGYGLGWNLDIRKVAALIVGGVFLVIGNYMPKFDEINGFRVDVEKTRKINRFLGYEAVVMGLLFLGSILLPPIATMGCLFLLIPYVIVGVVYGIVVGRK